MDRYRLCSDCSRHIKTSERACPFCRSPASLGDAALPARDRLRFGRARWLAFGPSLAAAACSPSPEALDVPHDASGAADVQWTAPEAAYDAPRDVTVDAIPDAPAEPLLDASLDASLDAPLDAAPKDAAAPPVDAPIADGQGIPPWLTPGTGTFVCYGNTGVFNCDRATSWCSYGNGGSFDTCLPLTTTCAPSSCFAWDASACDGGRPRCACINVVCDLPKCQDDDAGGVSVTCGSCYGAPPARLERFAV